MPVTLAHPAAILPLRRFCPRFLSFPALAVGSVCPDAQFAFTWLHAEKIAHRFLGSFVFCLPVGLLLLGMFFLGREGFVRLVPAPYQVLFRPICRPRPGSLGVVVFSLLVGAWTHQLLDSFTHDHGQAVLFFTGLQAAVGSLAGHQVRVFDLLWYASSFIGVAWLLLAYERLLMAGSTGTASWRPSPWNVANAFLLAGLVLPIGTVHQLANGWFSWLVVAGLTLGWGSLVVVSLRRLMAMDGKLEVSR